jgi:lipopolysaccharide transport system permease protein
LVVAYGLVFCFGLGLIFATASVRYRDVKFLLPFAMQILFYASPVFLSSSFFLDAHHLPPVLSALYQLNPLVFIMNAFKYCFYGYFENFSLVYALSSIGVTFLILVVSLKYFFNFEKSFADYI